MSSYLIITRTNHNRPGRLYLMRIEGNSPRPFRWTLNRRLARQYPLQALPQCLQLVRTRRGHAVALVCGESVVTLCERYPGDVVAGDYVRARDRKLGYGREGRIVGSVFNVNDGSRYAKVLASDV